MQHIGCDQDEGAKRDQQKHKERSHSQVWKELESLGGDDCEQPNVRAASVPQLKDVRAPCMSLIKGHHKVERKYQRAGEEGGVG